MADKEKESDLTSEDIINIYRAATLGDPCPIKTDVARRVYAAAVAFASRVEEAGGYVSIPHELPNISEE